MKCRYIVNLVLYFYASTILNRTHADRLPSHCQKANKNILIEHFFNMVLSELYATPPACVCVKMCPGDYTYCYPNGCMKPPNTIREGRDVSTKKSPLHTESQVVHNKQFTMADKYDDFMTDFWEKNYEDDSKTGAKKFSVQDLYEDPFNNKYMILGRLKRPPKVELKYNIREQAKNTKSDLVKTEALDLTKTRWPMKNQRTGQKPYSHPHTLSNIGKTHFFTKMLVENGVVEYPPKYFKRDLRKSPTYEYDDREEHFEKPINRMDNYNFSLESLIDSLIKNSYSTDIDKPRIVKKDESEMESNAPIENVISENSTGFPPYPNETPKVISMNFTNENVEKNEYVDDFPELDRMRNLKKIITYLEKQIDEQNNTSMEMARRFIGNNVATSVLGEVSLESYSDDQVSQDYFNWTTSPNESSLLHPDTTTSMPKEIKSTKNN